MTDAGGALAPEARAALLKVLEQLREDPASLSSITDQRAWQVHVVDSLTGLEVPELQTASRIADVGAGAGFPGLVLAAALPDSRVDLIESVGRKSGFIEERRMQQVGQSANFLGQIVRKLLALSRKGDDCGVLIFIFGRIVQRGKIYGQRGKGLPCVIVQVPGDAASFFVLGAQ